MKNIITDKTQVLHDTWAIIVECEGQDGSVDTTTFYVRQLAPKLFIWIWSNASTLNDEGHEGYETLDEAISSMFEEWSYA